MDTRLGGGGAWEGGRRQVDKRFSLLEHSDVCPPVRRAATRQGREPTKYCACVLRWENQQHTCIVLVARRQAGRDMAGQALGQSSELRMSCREGQQHVGQHACKVFRDGIFNHLRSPGIDSKDRFRQPM
jgi:hypothetical protein